MGGISVDENEEVETKDNSGTMVVHGGPGGTAISDLTTSDLNVPSSAGNVISGFSIECINKDANDILISYDGGTTHELFEMRRGNFKSSNITGNITQLDLKSTASTIDDAGYQIVLFLEDS